MTVDLTDRQLEILRAYGETGSTKIVARQLGRSPATVRTTLANVRVRLGVGTSVQAVMIVFGPSSPA
jgi:DNA-binding CsgD family transcriptional regulator